MTLIGLRHCGPAVVRPITRSRVIAISQIQRKTRLRPPLWCLNSNSKAPSSMAAEYEWDTLAPNHRFHYQGKVGWTFASKQFSAAAFRQCAILKINRIPDVFKMSTAGFQRNLTILPNTAPFDITSPCPHPCPPPSPSLPPPQQDIALVTTKGAGKMQDWRQAETGQRRRGRNTQLKHTREGIRTNDRGERGHQGERLWLCVHLTYRYNDKRAPLVKCVCVCGGRMSEGNLAQPHPSQGQG